MAKKSGSSKAEIVLRRENVFRLALRGYSGRQIRDGLAKQGVVVDQRTIDRDMLAVREDLLARRAVSELYSLQTAFAELNEVAHEAWGLYARPQPEVVGKEGEVTKLDDRVTKALLLREIRGVTRDKARLCGFYSPKVMERLTVVETPAGMAMQIERIPYTERIEQEGVRIMNDAELRASEGLS